MAVSLDGIDADFRQKVEAMLDYLRARGVEMRPCAARRSPQEQAKLWRQSRSIEQINAAIQNLKQQGAPFLAKILNDVGPQHGQHVTDALPGFSWHQWGKAVDCFWVVDGTAEWSDSRIVNGINGYRVYAATAKQFDIFAGGNWPRFKDWPHVQSEQAASPAAAGKTFAQVDAEMRRLYP